jgi:hypothetical protein
MSEADEATVNGSDYTVGFCRPPLHSRFKPGVSGNPSGRAKGSKNLKSLFHKILNEQIALQDGSKSRQVSKAEAIMRRIIIGALKGDPRSVMTMMRIAEQTGEFQGDELQHEPLTIHWMTTYEEGPAPPARRQVGPQAEPTLVTNRWR